MLVGQELAVLVLGTCHAAELDELEDALGAGAAAYLAGARLDEEGVPLHLDGSEYDQYEEHGREQDECEQSEHEVKNSLDYKSIHVLFKPHPSDVIHVLHNNLCHRSDLALRPTDYESVAALSQMSDKLHITRCLLKAPLNRLDNPVLSLLRKLVVARQAQAASEDVGIDRVAVRRRRYESISGEDGLHGHRLPDGASLRVDGGERREDLVGAGLAVRRGEARGGGGAGTLAHSVLIDEQAGEPEVRLAAVCEVRVHGHGEPRKALLIAHVDRFLLSDVLGKVRELCSDDAGGDI